MMLVESMHKEPLGFQLLRFDNQKDTYTIVVIILEYSSNATNLYFLGSKCRIPDKDKTDIKTDNREP